MKSILGTPIPEHWSTAPLKYVTALVNRGSAPEYVDDGPVRVVGQASNQNSGIAWERTRFHNFRGDPETLKGFLRAGDILINSTGTGTLGRVGFFGGAPDGLPCMADGHITVIRTRAEELHPRFAFYWLGSLAFRDYMYASMVVGATNQIELNRDRLRDAPVSLPPVEEQRRIADFLDAETYRIDQLLTARKRQQEIITFRIGVATENEFLHSPSSTPTRLKYLMRVKPRYGVLVPRFSDAGVPFIRVNELVDLESKFSNLERIPVELSSQYPRTVTQSGDVLLSVVGTMGRAIVVTPEMAGANIARAVASLRPRRTVDPHLVAAWAGTPGFMDQAKQATSSDTAQPTLGMEDLGNFQLSWPNDPADQQRLAIRVSEIRDTHLSLLRILRSQETVLAERRRALITAAATGQFDVTTASGRNLTQGV